jgi:hypothetical protein
VGPTRFERRPTMNSLREMIVGRRGEAPLVPPYILCNFKLAGTLVIPWLGLSIPLQDIIVT